MHIVINQSNNVFGMDAENKIFAQSTETITFDVTFNDPQATLQGLYCALLSDGGKTLALTTISENKAVLDTNTTECVEYVAQWAIGTTRHAFLVVGESTKPLAIIDVEVSQNPLEGLMPPTESAPSYPTSAELQAILAEVNAQAKVANESAQSANQSAIFVNTAKTEVVRIGAQVTTDKALIMGYASTASSGASRAEEAKRIAVSASEIVSEMQDEIGATKTKIDATAKVVQANADAVAGAKKEIDTAISTANTAINEAVGKAETAKGDAVKAQAEASKSAEQASTSASNASKSATASATSAQEAKQYAESGSDALNARILRENVGISVAEYRVEVGDSPQIIALVSAPKGAIAVSVKHNNIFWLHDGTFTQTQLLRSTLEMNGNFLLKWWEGNAVYAVYKGTDGATKKATITFVNNEPKTLDVQTLSNIDIATITEARYCYIEGDVVVTSKGQVFNKSTLAFIGAFTAPLYERMSPKTEDGYFKFITKGTQRYRMSRVAIQEDGTPNFSTYADCAFLSEPEPLMVGMMNIMGMAFDSSTTNNTSPWSTKTYARGLYLFDNSAGRTTPSVVAECLAEIYIPKNLYIGGASLTFIPAQYSLPFIRQVWRSSLSEIGAENSKWQTRSITSTFITTRSGDGRYYFVYSRNNVRPGLFVQEFTEVQ